MNNKLIVPARLERAAKQLKDNMTILKGCSPEVKEVIVMAAKQSVLRCFESNGTKCFYSNISGTVANIAYCLPDDIVIVVESQVPEWVSKKYTVCEVVNRDKRSYRISFPDNGAVLLIGLPAALRCDGWIFKGWLHEGNDLIKASPILYRDSDDSFWIDMSECQDERGCSVSTAYASVWQKGGEK